MPSELGKSGGAARGRHGPGPAPLKGAAPNSPDPPVAASQRPAKRLREGDDKENEVAALTTRVGAEEAPKHGLNTNGKRANGVELAHGVALGHTK